MAEFTQETLVRILQVLVKVVTTSVGSKGLTDEELSLVFSVDRERLQRVLDDIDNYSLRWCEGLLRYRRRRRDLEGLSTEELRNLYSPIAEARSRAIAADTYDTADDSLYESPPVDSDEHILRELLEERRQAGA